MELTKPGLDIIQPDRRVFAAAGVDALFTCRSGGVSSGAYGSADGIMGLNVAPHTGDFAACVRMNRGIVSQLVPTDPVWLRQVHGTEIVDAAAAQGEPEADASWSMTPGVVCAVMTADCLPVLLADAEGRIVAAVHAGWKSLAAGIIQKTVALMREKTSADGRIFAWLAPRIGEESFEVGEDVLEAMLTHLPDARAAFAPKADGKYLCDLALLARQALTLAGVADSDTDDCGLSTAADPKRFYSYRRDGEKSGRHAALIWIKPAADAAA